jgi:ribose transport system permease protein
VNARQQTAATAARGIASLRSLLALPNAGLVGVFILFIVAGTLASPQFLTQSNIITILTNASVIGIISVGMTFVILAAGIDLSVGALVALAAVWSTTNVNQSKGWVVMVAVALLVAVGCGAVNGVLIAYGRIVPFIATLAMLAAARGLALNISGGVPQVVTVEAFNRIGGGKLLGVPNPVWAFALVVIAGWVLLNRTTFGRRTVAIGGNAEASRLAGINVKRHTLLLYVLSGLCCGIAAILLTGRLTSGSNAFGNLYELDAIAAVIIGGTRLSGGRGTLIGSVLGVLIFTIINNVLILRNIESDIQSIAKGAIIVAAVLLQGRNKEGSG